MGFNKSGIAGPLLLLLVSFLVGGCGPDGHPSDAAEVDTSFNHTPVIDSIVPDPTRIDLDEGTTLFVEVEDPDGDPLSFAWSADCGGDFDDPTALEPTFTLTSLEADSCTLTLEVTDHWGATTLGAVTIATGPPVNGG